MEVLNLDKLQAKLDKIANIEQSQQVLQKACLLVENEAKVNCPVDKGQLRQSITSEVEGNVGLVGTNVEYAPYVEYGTGIFASQGDGRQDPWSYQDAAGDWHTTLGQKPQPFLNPALASNKNEILQLYADAIKEATK